MDHVTGKSYKLDAKDMSAMQDLVAEVLDMERGQKKSETGLDHLERNLEGREWFQCGNIAVAIHLVERQFRYQPQVRGHKIG